MYVLLIESVLLTKLLKEFDCLRFDYGIRFEDGLQDGEAMVVSNSHITPIF